MAESLSTAPSIRLRESGCLTAYGDATATWQGLLSGRSALRLSAVQGPDKPDLVPLALRSDDALFETIPPRWHRALPVAFASLRGQGWGTPRRPVVVTSSNFGVGSLHGYARSKDPGHLPYGVPFDSVHALRTAMEWGPSVTIFSHACITAHLGLLHGTRLLQAGVADDVLVFSFDFLSPFVAGGFYALKILNADFPTPYQEREIGSIGLGDGAAYAVLSRTAGDYRIEAQSIYNEMFHATSNQPDGSGFATCLREVANQLRGRRVWLKGHGTGTLEAGRLESAAFAEAFPSAPLVGWKGGIGHTLGSCGLVELAITLEALKARKIPGTVGSSRPTMQSTVALEPFDASGFDAVVCASNAFGGAHAAFLLSHV